jgi:zeta-carotene desaturase
MGKRVAVGGGGLAGMSAAVALESAGHNVTLIEARKTLGGRAGSFEDPQTGEILDNCQHVLLGCCTNLIDFYRRVGVLERIRWERTIHFFDASGREYRLKATPGLPAPLHLGLSGAAFGALTIKERVALSRAMLAMLRLGRAGRETLGDAPFGKWLREHGQPDGLIDKFYDLVLVSALNEKCRDAAASYAIKVFQEGMLAQESAYRMGTPACPLGKLYETIPCRDVRLGTRITGLRFDGNRTTGVELDGEFLAADAVVIAVNYPVLEKWIPQELAARDGRFVGLNKLQSVPILGAHLLFDRPIMSTPHAAFIGGRLQWVFRKPDGDGSSVHGVISAARDWIGKDKQECLDAFAAEIAEFVPTARGAKLLRGTIVVEKRATYSPAPGVDRHRPDQSPPTGGIEDLYLAGDYTRTAWPATMEGAVRSGYLAAESIAGTPGAFIVPDLKPQWPARFIGYHG